MIFVLIDSADRIDPITYNMYNNICIYKELLLNNFNN